METILSIFKNYGIFGVLFVIIGFVVYRYIATHIPIWAERRKNNIDPEVNEDSHSKYFDDEIDLKTHQIFTNINYIINIDIPHISLLPEKPNRELLFKTLLLIYIKTVYDICNKIIEEDMSEWEADTWSNELTNMIAQIVIETEKAASLDGIPLEVIKIFSNWNMNVIESLRESVSSLSKSKLYSDPISRTYTFLLMIDLLLITTLGDVERSIVDLNGEITGLKYKNLIIE